LQLNSQRFPWCGHARYRGRETVAPKVKAAEPITRGHKVAILPIAAGEPVRKFGQIIGNAP